MPVEHMEYDKRVVNLSNPPAGYAEYISSLRCCVCGFNAFCKCTLKRKRKPPVRKKVQIKSVCSPHRGWIETQINLGVNAKDIYRGLIHKFEFRNSYTSVKDFVRKLKGLKYGS